MSRLATNGFECNDQTLDIARAPGGATPVYSSSAMRTGRYGLIGNGAGVRVLWITPGTHGTDYFGRLYVRWSDFANGITVIGLRDDTTPTPQNIDRLLIDSAGALTSASGVVSQTLALNTWYRIEARVRTSASAFSTQVAYRLDGVDIGSISTINDTNHFQGIALDFAATTGSVVDDCAINDSNGTAQNTWCGSGSVVLALPESDNARATLWTGGVGGATNLWDAVNNTPPTGTATETDSTQIEHAGGAAGTTDAYDANMSRPDGLGIRGSDSVTLAQFLEVDGEDSGTGSKLLNFEVLSNPVIASPGNVTAGDDVGALGTYPTNWSVRKSTPVYNPAITVTSSPVMRARRPETASRVASVCFMGILFEYVPTATTPRKPTIEPLPLIPKGRSM